jgi:aryl-alcohol dehydrogenase-like predicted oxidoreductase
MTTQLTRRSFIAAGAAAAATLAVADHAIAAPKKVPVRDPHSLAANAGSVWLGGDLQLNRIGLGTAELTGPDRWGPPANVPEAHKLLRRAVALGVNYIDTADVYGPHVVEQLIHDALYPYPSDLVIGTKGGQTHDVKGPNGYDARPERLRAACEASLKRLQLEQIALYQMHSPDPKVPYEDSIGELARLQKEGKIRHIGVCNVDAALLAKARAIVKVASVQNRYNILSRGSDDLVALCERERIVFMPYGPLGGRSTQALKKEDARLAGLQKIAAERHIDMPQMVLAWLLARSPVMLPIPGTSKLAHMEENVGAAKVHLTREEMQRIDHSGSA